ncbi:hypothetical protein PtA15_2A2 [Puccinia triticina]|uniref:Ribosome biogenesis protein NOP53 n=1 Tax=Puccinia triticina TaxID=208348 RepID=A0ABY7C932_9BASI|nr:uncharacterized protein PtA15_2A2 [Puccinia triticina]WAQ81691.1 hypothetical protein PtA15_2A2 [Puccinia triticina]
MLDSHMNLLSATTYKKSTSRIAPARPHYVARVKRERANLPITTFVDPNKESFRVCEDKAAQQLERKLAKSRARKRGTKAYESPIMELMTCKKFRVARRQCTVQFNPLTPGFYSNWMLPSYRLKF